MLKIAAVIACTLALFYLGVYLAFNVQVEWLGFAIMVNTIIILAAGIVWTILTAVNHFHK